MARVWIDVLTPKQAKLFASMARQSSGLIDPVFTTRRYEYTVAVLRRFGYQPMVFGGYGTDLRSKLVEEFRRGLEVLEKVPSFDFAMSYPNPLAARVSFGLGKPYIAFTDSPHSVAVSRLSLPLATAVVFSSCIPLSEISKYVYPGTHLEMYRGVDEVQWLKNFEPSDQVLKELDLEPRTYVVARPPEHRAAYYSHGTERLEIFRSILVEILKRGYTVVYLPRYEDDELPKELQRYGKVVVPSTEQGVDGSNLVYHALAVITGGGSMAREAALLGTLGITLYPNELYVDRCIENWGLPHRRVHDVSTCLQAIEEFARDPDRYRATARSLRQSLETPLDGLKRVLHELRMR